MFSELRPAQPVRRERARVSLSLPPAEAAFSLSLARSLAVPFPPIARHSLARGISVRVVRRRVPKGRISSYYFARVPLPYNTAPLCRASLSRSAAYTDGPYECPVKERERETGGGREGITAEESTKESRRSENFSVLG